MHNATSHRRLGRPHTAAITWIDRRHAIVARTTPSGTIDVEELPFAAGDTADAAALTRVADSIGDRDRVLVAGPRNLRTALERQYVSIYRRPDRLVDVETDVPLGKADLVDRLRQLAG